MSKIYILRNVYNTFDIIWLGRGGQGGVTAARIFAQAAAHRGLYALAIPFFGAERRGAPVFAYNRVSEEVIRKRSRVRAGDLLVVLDPSLLEMYDVAKFLKSGGKVVVNSTGEGLGEEIGVKKVFCLDASGIAMELGLRLAGFPLVNMPMLGAAGRVSGLLDKEALAAAVRESIESLVEKNVEAVNRGFDGVKSCV